MQLIRFCGDHGQIRWGVKDADGHRDLTDTIPGVGTIQDLIGQWEEVGSTLPAVAECSSLLAGTPSLLSPVPEPPRIICIGLNYRDHAIESGMEIPCEPVVFNKLAGTICGPDAEVPLPACSKKVDYEAELVVVVGKRAWQVSEADAAECIFGYTCGHDVSARDWQLGRPGGQWLLGKSFPNFAPIGPVLVPAAYMPDPQDLCVKLRLNGETLQDSTTRQLIFTPAQLIAHISQCCELQPGDVLFTGTPPGVGAARKPPRFLRPGDVAEVEIDGIGVLRNRFVDSPKPA
ncbi:MAG: fumarylacetoacetate hydrolase family protein [Planctomycetales bacterium]|nr:fumarylacetoacetate hydrolase family protein [Planctomycetales bacterium]